MSIEEVVKELERLTPEQLEQVAELIHGLAKGRDGESRGGSVSVPAYIAEEAIAHGWPGELFSEVIGSLPDVEHPPQPPVESRSHLSASCPGHRYRDRVAARTQYSRH